MSEKRRPALGMRLPEEFEATFKARAEAAGCFPAQRLQALEQLVAEEGLERKLRKLIKQIQAEARLRQTEGARVGGQGGHQTDYLAR